MNRLSGILWLLPGVIIACLLLFVVDFGEVVLILNVAKPLYIAVGLALTLLWLLSDGTVLYFIRSISDDPQIPIHTITEATLVSNVVNQITPFSRVGGQPICAKILSEYSGIKTEKELGNIVVKYLLESAIMIILGTIGIVHYIPASSLISMLPEIPRYIVVTILSIVLSLIILMYRNRMLIRRFTPDFILNGLLESKDTLLNNSVRKAAILVPIALIPLIVQTLSVTVFLLSLSIEISIVEVLLVLTSATLLGFFIPSTGMSGIQESMILFILTLADPSISVSVATALVLLTSVSTYAMLLILGTISIRAQYKILEPESCYLSKAYSD